MRSERSQRVESIFKSALERDATQRAAFLDGACSEDPSLRSEVESRISAHEQSSSSRSSSSSAESKRAQSMAGRTLGHYKILSLLGAGGMGEVYLAQDTRLGRNVALKLLPAEFTEDEERVRRFQQEARAASALNHPNIITVYDIGHDEGQHYIAAEFIEAKRCDSQSTAPGWN